MVFVIYFWSPWANAGFALGGGIAGGAMHIIYYSINRLSYNDNKNTVNQQHIKEIFIVSP